MARLARIEPDDRMTLCGECEPFRLAIQIAEPPRIKERSAAAARREIIEPRNSGGFVAEQIEATIGTNFEVTEVGAGLASILSPLHEHSEEGVAKLFGRPNITR